MEGERGIGYVVRGIKFILKWRLGLKLYLPPLSHKKYIINLNKIKNLEFYLKISYLYFEYKPKYYYWEVMKLYVRIFIVLAVAALKDELEL